MKILIIDNYDSFTFNLSQLVAEIVGNEPVVVRNDEVSFEDLQQRRFDAILISPGPGRPARATDIGISAEAILQADVPVLGVCLGHQAIYQVFGGRIEYAPEPMHGRLSPIHHNGAKIFKGLPNPFPAVRYHSLIGASPLPADLEMTAWLEDGTIMGIAHRSRPLWGVQFHPESICTENGRALIENFLRLAGWLRIAPRARPVRERPAYNQPPPLLRRIDRKVDPESLFRALFGREEIALWLDSSLQGQEPGRFSVMAGGPSRELELLRYRVATATVEVDKNGRRECFREDLFPFLQNGLTRRRSRLEGLPFEFHGGYIGYFGYELRGICGGRSSLHPSVHPDCLLVFVDRFVVIDHWNDAVYVLAPAEEAQEWFARINAGLEVHLDLCEPVRPEGSQRFYVDRTRQQYLRDIDTCQGYIREGESYEICLTNRVYAYTGENAFQYYRRLRASNPTPHSAFLRFPELAVACSSPERFLKVSSGGLVETRPIKGTLPRAATPDEDARVRRLLETGLKYRAENLMIVDLLRNDLGKVCEPGSVRVPSLMQVESYPGLHQLVSTVTGQLREGCQAIDCLRAAFPGGSMTGAPKLRTMELIDQLEATPRGIYSGSIGYLSVNGAADLNMVIRTAVFSGAKATIGTGGAITAMSDPAEEWSELILKARSLLKAFGPK